jgi:hypothetical protein
MAGDLMDLAKTIAAGLVGDMGLTCAVGTLDTSEPPRVLTVRVQPIGEGTEEPFAIPNDFRKALRVEVRAWTPGGKSEASFQSLVDTCTAATGWVEENRELTDYEEGRSEGYEIVTHDEAGVTLPTWYAAVRIVYLVERNVGGA